MQQSKLGKMVVFYQNSGEFRHLKNEIWTRGAYFWDDEDWEEVNESLNTAKGENEDLCLDAQVIFDLGAHIGISTLYLAQMYPEARVVAVEPNPSNFAILRKNITENMLSDRVELVNAAVGLVEGEKDFFVDKTIEVTENWSMSGSFHPGAWNMQEKKQDKISVKTIKLSNLIDHYSPSPLVAQDKMTGKQESLHERSKIDLIKMDIEGVEGDVLREISEVLGQVRRIIFEYHPRKGASLLDLVRFLERKDFMVKVEEGESGRKLDLKAKKWREPEKLVMVKAKNQLNS